ncbi:MAG TPA: beta-galactosidase, partial [Mycobacterium sp.]|nr:beta-galactosidase [Mycobacterium sp.]
MKALVPVLLLALMTAPTMHAAALRPSAAPAQRQLVLEVSLAASITDANTTVGMADSNLYGESQADVDKSLDEMKAMGVNDVRILIPWAYVEPLPGVYNWSQLDMIVNAANERGMGVLGVLNSTP